MSGWRYLPTAAVPIGWSERIGSDRIFEEIWQAVPAVLLVAEQESRALIPEFWRARDEAATAGTRLSVCGVWIDPVSGSADYEVSGNPFDTHDNSLHLPVLPENHRVLVSRSADGALLPRI